MPETVADGVRRLQAVHREGELETVRICFADHYGVLRGRRIVAERFLADPTARQAFCDGALVWDIRCDIFEEADFSNYRTGYPDLYAHPDLGTVRPCGWSEREFALISDCCDAHGEVLEVDPRQALRRAVEKLGGLRVTTSFELRVEQVEEVDGSAPGRPGPFARKLGEALAVSELGFTGTTWDRGRCLLTVSLAESDAIAAADATVIARSAAREIALTDGVAMTCMPRTTPEQDPASLVITAELDGVDFEAFADRLADVDLFLRPLPIAHGGAVPLRAERHGERVRVLAASDANPYLAIAAVAMALGEAREKGAAARAGGRECEWGYGQAISRFAGAEWLSGWVDSLLAHDALELAKRELALRAEQVSDWDIQRYRECG